MTVFVDDRLFASNDQQFLYTFKSHIASKFDVKLYGLISSFIRWEVERSSDGIKVTQ